MAAIRNLGNGSTYWPTLPLGSWHASGAASTGLSSSATVGAADNMTLIPFVVPRDCAVTQIGFTPTSASNGGMASAGIYSDASGAPGALLASMGQISSGATGLLEFAGVSLTLNAGIPYWAALAVTVGTQTFLGLDAGTYQSSSQGLGFASGTTTTAAVALVQALASGWTALPATAAPTGTATSTPVVFFNG